MQVLFSLERDSPSPLHTNPTVPKSGRRRSGHDGFHLVLPCLRGRCDKEGSHFEAMSRRLRHQRDRSNPSRDSLQTNSYVSEVHVILWTYCILLSRSPDLDHVRHDPSAGPTCFTNVPTAPGKRRSLGPWTLPSGARRV